MILQHKISKPQIKPQVVSGLDIYFFEATCVNVGLNFLTYIPSDLDPQLSHLQTHKRFVASLSCDLEPDITIPTASKIVVLANKPTDLSAVLYLVQESAQLLFKPFFFNRSCHYF